MKTYTISVNQLADFTKGTEARRRRIIKDQKAPETVIIGRYNLAKARIRKSVARRGDITPIIDGLQTLKLKKPETAWQENDKKVSIEALERYVKMQLPKILKDLDSYEVLSKFEFKSFMFSGVQILVSPDVIVKGIIGDTTYVGAVKLHVSKSGAFDSSQSKYVATCIYNYLNTMLKDNTMVVLPELCISLDVFAGTFICAPKNIDVVNDKIKEYCEQIIMLWDAA